MAPNSNKAGNRNLAVFAWVFGLSLLDSLAHLHSGMADQPLYRLLMALPVITAVSIIAIDVLSKGREDRPNIKALWKLDQRLALITGANYLLFELGHLLIS